MVAVQHDLKNYRAGAFPVPACLQVSAPRAAPRCCGARAASGSVQPGQAGRGKKREWGLLVTELQPNLPLSLTREQHAMNRAFLKGSVFEELYSSLFLGLQGAGSLFWAGGPVCPRVVVGGGGLPQLREIALPRRRCHFQRLAGTARFNDASIYLRHFRLGCCPSLRSFSFLVLAGHGRSGGFGDVLGEKIGKTSKRGIPVCSLRFLLFIGNLWRRRWR